MKELIQKIVEKQDLTREEAARAMDLMLEGKASQVQMAAFLTALRMKGETVDEITGCTQMMKSKAEKLSPLTAEDYIDFVGTGGDGTNSFNISTTSAFVCAAAGVPVAKHGNRAASSKSGASDLLEALGVNIMLDAAQVSECINKINIGFMNAQRFHKAMKNVAPVRGELGIRTIFNMLGPLSNPSEATHQVIGVFSAEMVPVFAEVMMKLGVKRALVVHGNDGMDEITTTTTTLVNELRDGEIISYTIDPADYGIPYAAPEDLKGGTGAENAAITNAVFAGEKGPKRDIVVLNSAAGLYIGGKAADIAEGIRIAEEIIDSGKAAAKVREMAELTSSMGGNA